MTHDGSYVLREVQLPQLVQVIMQPDGATMSCYYCRHRAPVEHGDVARQILQFQDAHFGCDPTVATTTVRRARNLPRQGGRD